MSEEELELEADKGRRVLRCNKCGSIDVRRSDSVGFIAAVQRSFGRWPFRCRSCRRKFYLAAKAPRPMVR